MASTARNASHPTSSAPMNANKSGRRRAAAGSRWLERSGGGLRGRGIFGLDPSAKAAPFGIRPL
jgi:hypothetical protein